jgi:hypothetical protein
MVRFDHDLALGIERQQLQDDGSRGNAVANAMQVKQVTLPAVDIKADA